MPIKRPARTCWWGGTAVAFLLVVLTIHTLRPVYACTPPPGGLPSYSVADRTKAADIVFEGTVVDVDLDAFPNVATIAVTAYYKGRGPAEIVVGGYGDSSVCLSRVDVDDYYVFYVDARDDGTYHASYLSQFDAVDPANRESVDEILDASQAEPFFPLLEGDESAGDAEAQDAPDQGDVDTGTLIPLLLFGGTVICLLLIAPLVIVLGILRWRGAMPEKRPG